MSSTVWCVQTKMQKRSQDFPHFMFIHLWTYESDLLPVCSSDYHVFSCIDSRWNSGPASLERCNKQNLGGCSICINTLPGMSPRAREPRTVPSLHTSLLLFPPVTFPCRQNMLPMRRQANQYPLSHPAPPLTTLPLFLILPFPLPKYTVAATVIDSLAEWYRCRRAPSLSSTLSVSAVYVQLIFALIHSSGNWCDLEEDVCVF